MKGMLEARLKLWRDLFHLDRLINWTEFRSSPREDGKTSVSLIAAAKTQVEPIKFSFLLISQSNSPG